MQPLCKQSSCSSTLHPLLQFVPYLLSTRVFLLTNTLVPFTNKVFSLCLSPGKHRARQPTATATATDTGPLPTSASTAQTAGPRTGDRAPGVEFPPSVASFASNCMQSTFNYVVHINGLGLNSTISTCMHADGCSVCTGPLQAFSTPMLALGSTIGLPPVHMQHPSPECRGP